MKTLTACIFSFYVVNNCYSQNLTSEEFRQKAEPAWTKLRSIASNITVSAINEEENSNVDYSRFNDAIMSVESNNSKEGAKTNSLRGIVASNSKYHFWIQESRRNEWQLRVYEKRSEAESDTTKQLKSRYIRISHAWDHPGIHCPLSETFSNAKCRWKSFRYLQYQGRDCVEAVLEEKYQYNREQTESIVSSICVFEPEKGWLIHKMTRTTSSKLTSIPKLQTVTWEYGSLSLGGLPFPSKITNSTHYGQQLEPKINNYIFHAVAACKLSHEEFYLLNYNLPEPGGIEPQSNSTRYIYILLGTVVILGLLSYFFANMRRRRALNMF